MCSLFVIVIIIDEIKPIIIFTLLAVITHIVDIALTHCLICSLNDNSQDHTSTDLVLNCLLRGMWDVQGVVLPGDLTSSRQGRKFTYFLGGNFCPH